VQEISQIKVPRILIVLAAVMAMFVLVEFSGCGTVREGVIFDSETGEHISGWIDKHGGFFIKDTNSCDECHGDKLDGGISGVDCYDNSFNGVACHGGVVHLSGWETDHALVARSDNSSCSTTICHGVGFTGGVVRIGCYDCHLGGPNPSSFIMHPDLWQDPDKAHKKYLENLDKDASRCSPSRPGIAQYCHGEGLPDDQSLLSAPPNGSWSEARTCFEHHDKKWSAP
jgi:hypothetical protein